MRRENDGLDPRATNTNRRRGFAIAFRRGRIAGFGCDVEGELRVRPQSFALWKPESLLTILNQNDTAHG